MYSKMMFQASLYVSIILIGVHGKELDPGPQTFSSNDSSSSMPVQALHKRFATKEVVVYLTPTQIKDLESGKAELRSQSPDEITINQLANSPKQPYQNPQISYQRHIENLNILKAPLIPEPRLQNKQTTKQDGILIENSSEKQKNEELSKSRFLQLGKPNNGFKNQQNNRYKEGVNDEWRAFVPITEKNQEAPSLQEQLNEHWQQILENNREQLKQLPNNQPHYLQNPSTPIQYAPNFYVRQHDFQLENVLRENNINEIEKQRAIAQAAAIANLPPVIIHKEVQITKHRPIPIVKHINVPVPTPVLVPVPEPYAVKVPQPYPVPVEVIRHIPVPVKVEQTEKSPVGPNEGQKHIPVRNVYINVDSPSLYAWRN